MRIILLPGLDGTGLLFKPLLDQLSADIHAEVISYPTDRLLGYPQLEKYVEDKLPKNEDFILVGESFSGCIAYGLARKRLRRLKSVIFVASFLRPPSGMMKLIHILPLSLIIRLPIPGFVLKSYLLGNDAGCEMVGLFKEALKKVSADVLVFRLKQVAGLAVEIEELGVPCSYVQAKTDKLVPADNIELFRSVSQELKEVSVRGPHFILQARPAECAKVIVDEYRLIKTCSG
jgi:pimeloyl-ACP methyl ester carboxylesterase